MGMEFTDAECEFQSCLGGHKVRACEQCEAAACALCLFEQYCTQDRQKTFTTEQLTLLG